MASTPILFDYGSSPYSQKVHHFCAAAAGITIKSCEQPPVLPRPTLENLEITYRRIPILAIGKDLFADSSLIIDALRKNFNSKLPTSPADEAYKAFGTLLFSLALSLAPVESLPASFLKDREPIFPEICRPDHAQRRPSAISEFMATLDIFENQFLGDGKQWISGDKISMSDVHVAWVVRWLLNGCSMKEQPGFGKMKWPNIYAWIERLPQKEAEKLSDDEATKLIMSSPYFTKEEDLWGGTPSEPLSVRVGESVSVEQTDSKPEANPQHGKLVGLTIDTVIIHLKNELRVHFPRKGTIVTKA